MPEETRKKISESLKGARQYSAKKVAQYTKTGELIQVWDYIKQAENELGIAHGNITLCCKHKNGHKTAGGYRWEYHTE